MKRTRNRKRTIHLQGIVYCAMCKGVFALNGTEWTSWVSHLCLSICIWYDSTDREVFVLSRVWQRPNTIWNKCDSGGKWLKVRSRLGAAIGAFTFRRWKIRYRVRECSAPSGARDWSALHLSTFSVIWRLFVTYWIRSIQLYLLTFLHNMMKILQINKYLTHVVCRAVLFKRCPRKDQFGILLELPNKKNKAHNRNDGEPPEPSTSCYTSQTTPVGNSAVQTTNHKGEKSNNMFWEKRNSSGDFSPMDRLVVLLVKNRPWCHC